MTQREELIVRAGFDNTALASGLRQAGTLVDGWVGGIKRAFTNFGGLLSIGGLMAGIDRAMAKVDQIRNAAEVTGQSAEGIQRIDFAASQLGINTDKTNRALENLNELVGQAREKGGAAAEVFKHWGIEIQDRNNAEVLAEVSDKLHGMTDPAQQLAMAADLFRKKMAEVVLPLLNKGADALKAMGAGASIFSEQNMKDITEAHQRLDAVGNTTLVWIGKAISATAELSRDLGNLKMFGGGGLEYDQRVIEGSKRLVEERIRKEADWIADNGLPRYGPEVVTETHSKAELDAARAMDDLMEKRMSINARVTFHEDKVLSLKEEEDALDEKAVDYAEKKAGLALEITEQTNKVNAALEDGIKLDEEAMQIARKIQESRRKISENEKEYPTLGDLAGRGFKSNLDALYGEGGRFDLGAGNGPFAGIAQEYLLAQKQQLYDRTYGNLGAAEADRQRMIAARKQLGVLGVESPAMDIAQIRDDIAAMVKHLAELKERGANESDPLFTKISSE